MEGDNNTALLEVLAWRFMSFGDSDVRPRVIQGIGSEARGEGRERGNLIDLIETISKPPLAQRAGGI